MGCREYKAPQVVEYGDVKDIVLGAALVSVVDHLPTNFA
ncbi:MAG: lasso RiPP family leader peptide-containing protein [Candidatus Hydrogenedentes bacterium]|nr:lasso RiPP family leader peptide-containing protein [Candidatus Hydrogenedentota bacterium]